MNRSQMVMARVSRTLTRPAVFAALAFVMVAQSAMAQSTIFNIPSTDTVSKGKGYFEIDLLPQAPMADSGSIFFWNPRIVAGVAPGVEVGLNFPVYHIGDGSPSNFAYIQPNVKWRFASSDAKGVAASVGLVVNAPLNEGDGQGPWSYIYANVSKKWMGTYGPRVTFGPYGVVADQDSGKATFVGTRGGVLFGYEQPIGGPVSFVADWFSGQNSVGYFTPGISIVLPHSGLFNLGYSIGNDGAKENRFLFLYYGVTFP